MSYTLLLQGGWGLNLMVDGIVSVHDPTLILCYAKSMVIAVNNSDNGGEELYPPLLSLLIAEWRECLNRHYHIHF